VAQTQFEACWLFGRCVRRVKQPNSAFSLFHPAANHDLENYDPPRSLSCAMVTDTEVASCRPIACKLTGRSRYWALP
jgi:hypothetical protein